MTIIAFKDGVMAADGWVMTGSMALPVAFPKITPLPDGSIVGAAGYACDCYAAMEWMRRGMVAPEPALLGKPDDDREVDLLWAKPDGSLWRNSIGCAGWYPVPSVYAIGNPDAAIIATTAMYIGQSAEQAVRTTAQLCCSIGGPVQVETL